MPSAKSGSPGSLVPSAAPDPALDADHADPGEVEKVKAAEKETESGKYGETQEKAFKPAKDDAQDPDKKVSWIEIVLVDDGDNPVPGEAYKITMPDDSVCEGTLDQNGFARVPGMEPGNCKVTFPQLDGRSWKKT